MELWKLLATIFGIFGTLYAGIHAYFISRAKSKVESFNSIMVESKRFRDEIRVELERAREEAKEKMGELLEKIRKYEGKILDLEEKLRDALTPRTWLYYYILKPIKQFEIETIFKRHLKFDTDTAMVIHDDPNTEKIIDSLHIAHNWNFLRATNGKIALEMLKIERPKIIMVDLVLPVIDGFEVINSIHENKNLTGIPIVVVSSSNLKEVDRVVIHNKINEILTKN